MTTPRSPEVIRTELQAVAAALDPAEGTVSDLYARRLSLLVEARALPPEVRPTITTLAEWASTPTRRTTEGAINQVLRKWTRAQSGEPRRPSRAAR